MPPTTEHEQAEQLLFHLARIAQLKRPPITDENALEWLSSNWRNCADGLLKRTTRIRVTPEESPAPMAFEFEMETPYKRKIGDGPVELMPGPVRGRIFYNPEMFDDVDVPTIAVLIDPELAYFHPNHSRATNFLCYGDESNFEAGFLPLDRLLEAHIFPVVSYQNRRPAHPFDLDAARFFALEPAAMEGLEPVAPLY